MYCLFEKTHHVTDPKHLKIGVIRLPNSVYYILTQLDRPFSTVTPPSSRVRTFANWCGRVRYLADSPRRVCSFSPRRGARSCLAVGLVLASPWGSFLPRRGARSSLRCDVRSSLRCDVRSSLRRSLPVVTRRRRRDSGAFAVAPDAVRRRTAASSPATRPRVGVARFRLSPYSPAAPPGRGR